MPSKDSLTAAIVSWLIAPSFLATTIVAIYNVASKSIQQASMNEPSSSDQQHNQQEQEEVNFGTPIMSEPSPSKTLVRQEMPTQHQQLITNNGTMLLDKDLQFISGESEMPLSVYESPLMNAYRNFTKMKKDDRSDGFYVVHRRKITNSRSKVPSQMLTYSGGNDQEQMERSMLELLSNEAEEDLYGDHDDSEVMLLYGRGPVFDLNTNYGSDRFEGIDD